LIYFSRSLAEERRVCNVPPPLLSALHSYRQTKGAVASETTKKGSPTKVAEHIVMEVIVVLREETFVQVRTMTETIMESIKQSPITPKHKKFTARIKATTSTNKSIAPVTSIVLPSSKVAISVKVGSSIFVPLASSPSTFSQLVSSSLRISIPSSIPISSAVALHNSMLYR